jgi:methyltransferase
VTALWLVVGLVTVQRLAELAYSRRNERRLKAEGGVEHGAGHYPVIAGLHLAWLISMLLEVPADAPVRWPFLIAFLALQGLRAWVMTSLGRHWTTRVIVVPGRPLVRVGPYRYLKHPNYLVVAGEIALLPLAFGAWRIAVVYSVLNALLLWHRIRVENRALASVSAAAPASRG